MKIWKFLIITGALISGSIHADMGTYLAQSTKYKNYMMPIKVSDQEQFLYVYSLLLDREIIAGTSPYPISIRDDFIRLKMKCDTVGAMLTSRDFLKLNKELAGEAAIKRYENDEHLKDLIRELGNSCTSIPK